MAVYTYGATNVSWSSTDSWANEINGLSNIHTSGSAGAWADDMYTLPGPSSISVGTELKSQAIFYGQVTANANGSVRVSSPYTTSYTTGTITIKNVNLSVHGAVVLQASPTYPYIFQGWTTNNTGVIGTSTSLTLNSTTATTSTTFYANFTVPASNTVSLAYHLNTAEISCSDWHGGSRTDYYYSSDDAGQWFDAYRLYSNAALTAVAKEGWYSDGDWVVYVDNTGAPGIPQMCTV